METSAQIWYLRLEDEEAFKISEEAGLIIPMMDYSTEIKNSYIQNLYDFHKQRAVPNE